MSEQALNLLLAQRRRAREEEEKVVEKPPIAIRKLVAEPAVYPRLAPPTEKELLEAGYRPATVEEVPFALQLATRKGIVYYVKEEPPPRMPTFPLEERPRKPTYLEFRRAEYKEMPSMFAPTLWSIKMAKLPRWSETLAPGTFERGFIASGEALAETFLPYPTPRPKYHELGYLVFEAPIPEKLGYLTGEALQAVAIGKILTGPITVTSEAIAKVGGKIVPETVKRAVKFGRVPKAFYRAKLAVKAKLPTWRGTRVEQWLYEHSKWYAKRVPITRGEVAIPRLVEPVGLKQLQASQLAWELTRFPRTGGVWLAQIGVAPVKAKVLPHLVFRAGKISVGYLREPLMEEPYWMRGLLPYVTQKQVTRMGIIPYIPRAVAVTGKRGVSQLVAGLGLATLAKTLTQPQLRPRRKRRRVTPLLVTPKVWQPTLAFEREMFRPLTILEPKVKEKERAIAIPDITQALVQEQEAIVKTVQRQRQALIPKIPVPTILKPPTYPPYWRRRGPRETFGRRFEAFLGKWYYRKHPIPTPEQLARQMMGLPAKRRKKVVKKKRRKKKVRRRKI